MQPTLVLIPGLWHGPECFAALRSQLEPKYDTVTDKMPSVGAADPTKIGLQNDIEHVRNRLLLPLLEQNKDIVLVMHSYAGIPGAAAVEGLDEESRGPGKGAVLGLIYLSANVIPEEINQMEAWEEAEPGYSFKYISLPEDMSYTFVKLEAAMEYLYHDLPKSEAERWTRNLQTSSAGVAMTRVPYSAFFHAEWKRKCRYIEMTGDRINPPKIAHHMARDMLRGPALDTGHCSFLVKPRETADAIVRCVADIEREKA